MDRAPGHLALLESLLLPLALVPMASLWLVVVAAWLLRRQPGRVRPAWIVVPACLLVAADEVPLPGAPGGWNEALPGSHMVGGGFSAGSYQTCSGARQYSDAGLIYRYSTPISGETSLNVGGGLYGGLDGGEYLYGAGHAEGGIEHRWAAARIGFVAGGLMGQGAPLDTPVVPSAAVRLGPRDIAWLDAGMFDSTPAALPGELFRVGAGVAVRSVHNPWEPLAFRAGVASGGVYLGSSFPLGEVGAGDLLLAYGDPATWRFALNGRFYWKK